MLRVAMPADAAPDESQPAASNEPSAAEIRTQLARILSQPAFSASARNRRFLTYVIEETLEGRGSRIKAYTVALAVFDRDQNFDPLIDPIVRIEASRLRRAIEHYYLTAGRDDTIRIDIPKGSYVPTFGYLAAPPLADSMAPPALGQGGEDETGPACDIDLAALPARRRARFLASRPAAYAFILLIALAVIGWMAANGYGIRKLSGDVAERSQAPSIFVEPFVTANDGTKYDYIAAGLTYDIISNLTRFEDIFVYGSATSFNAAQGSDAAKPAIPDTDYVLSGSIQNSAQTVQLNVILTDRHTGRHVWALDKQWSLSTENLLQVSELMTAEIVNALALPDGVLLDDLKKKMASTPAAHLTSYECIVKFRQYWRKSRREDFTVAEDCLTQTLRGDPNYAPAYAALSLVYLDRYRFNFASASGPKDLLAEATRLAQRAHELEPKASRPYLALSLAYWFKNEVDKSIALAEQGLALYPHNAELLADLGLRYALLGRWDKSEPMIDEAYRRDPAAPSGYHIGHFLYAYMRGDYALALDDARKIEAPYVVYGHLAIAATYGQMGDAASAAPAIAEIRRLDPDYAGKVREDLQKRNLAPQIIDAIIDGLHKAGFTPEAL